MRRPPLIAALLGLCVVSAHAALAQAPPAPHEVSPVTIYPAGNHPKVVATFPAAGQTLDGGVLILTVSFDQPMSPGGYDLTVPAGGEPLPCLTVPRLLDDRRTFAWLCTARSSKTYVVAFNAGAAGGFVNDGDQRALPVTLTFTTTASVDGPKNVAEAVKQAKLKAFEIPIQETPGLAANPEQHRLGIASGGQRTDQSSDLQYSRITRDGTF